MYMYLIIQFVIYPLNFTQDHLFLVFTQDQIPEDRN